MTLTTPLELIVGNTRVTPTAIHRIAGGVEAVLKGEAMRHLLDATFHAAGSIEVLGGDLHRRRVEVSGIRMQGAETRVTLICSGPAPALM